MIYYSHIMHPVFFIYWAIINYYMLIQQKLNNSLFLVPLVIKNYFKTFIMKSHFK